MQAASKSKIGELQAIMTKMPFKVCCVYALPEFGVRWSEVSRAVRNARLPMTSASVARIICRHVAKSLPADDVEDIIATLQLKLVATQTRTWHALRLLHRDGLEPAAVLARRLPGRLRSALSEGRARNMRAEVLSASPLPLSASPLLRFPSPLLRFPSAFPLSIPSPLIRFPYYLRFPSANPLYSSPLPISPLPLSLVMGSHLIRFPSLISASPSANPFPISSSSVIVATQTRTWHALRLLHRDGLEPAAVLARRLPGRLRSALSEGRARNMRAEVQTAMMGDLIYVSVRLVSATREGSVLYLAVPPGQDALLTSSLSGTTLLKAAVQALGYKEYQNMNLHGHDIDSLLRISDPAWNGPADHLSAPPDYAPAPVVTPNGIDYTNKTYDERYVDQIIGPQPPLLTDITITATKSFFDPSRLNKQMNLTVRLKSDDVAKSLKSWVSRGALAPTSDFFQIYHKIKSNKITYTQDSD